MLNTVDYSALLTDVVDRHFVVTDSPLAVASICPSRSLGAGGPSRSAEEHPGPDVLLLDSIGFISVLPARSN